MWMMLLEDVGLGLDEGDLNPRLSLSEPLPSLGKSETSTRGRKKLKAMVTIKGRKRKRKRETRRKSAIEDS